jgi:ATP:ADP antiporter, AAA family
MHQTIITWALKPFGQIRRNEAGTAVLMFVYSFLLMAAYSVIKPATRSNFIDSLGPQNLPYIQLAAGILIGFVMAGYSRLVKRLPRQWTLSIIQGGIAGILIVFWFLFLTKQPWVSAAFYLLGLILGILLISQFWTLASVVFDPRQAKRLFGFIGGGASVGGILGSFLAKQISTNNLLLYSAGFMVLSIAAVNLIMRREKISAEMQGAVASVDQDLGGKEALHLLRKSKHLRLIALVISLAAIGAVIIEQQLNMAAAAVKGPNSKDAITMFLANVQLWTSIIGLLVQILLTSRIHRHLGISFALLLLPISLGSSAAIMLVNAALWAPGLARVMDQSLRYTIDKTTREILYLPLPANMRVTVKPFVDVTVDRLAKGLAAIVLLFLIQPWGMGLSWQKLSYVNIAVTGIWIIIALLAQRGYKQAFRENLRTRAIKPAEVPAAAGDLAVTETLVQELSSPDPQRVLYAMEFLESLDKQHLITPLLLYHESSAVRARALRVMHGAQEEISSRWLPAIHSILTDLDPNVRAEGMSALAGMNNREASDLVRVLMQDKNPRISLTAAMILAGSEHKEDASAAESVLSGLLSDASESAAPVRREFAIALRQAPIPHFRRLLIPLLTDPDPDVAEEALQSARKLGASDFVFVPTLIALLRNRRLKNSSRELLVGFGPSALPILDYFLRDVNEDIWIRRHIPGTIARIPCQEAMNILEAALDELDGFLRFHVISAIERIYRLKPNLRFDRNRIKSLILEEAARHAHYSRLHRILHASPFSYKGSLIARASVEKIKRTSDRIYRLLSLLYPWRDIAAARHTIEHGDARSRAGTIEYLDNALEGSLRKSLIPLLEGSYRGDSSASSKDASCAPEEALLELIYDEDPVVASAAIYLIWQRKLLKFISTLERILAARDDRNQHVLETAAWVAQELRQPAPQRRLIWLDPLPSMDLTNQLYSLPLFGSVAVDEVFRICTAGCQERSEPGRLLFKEASIPEKIQFLLNGRVSVTRPGREPHQIEAPAVLAFQEALEERPMEQSIETADLSVCLTLSSEEMRDLLSENSDLVAGLFQMLYRDSRAERIVVKGSESLCSAFPTGGGLNRVEKGLMLKSIPVFSLMSADEILILASIAVEMRLSSGERLVAEADRPAIYAMISGELSIEESGKPPILVEPSDIIGIYETLAKVDFEFRANVRKNGLALRINHEDLFDLLSQRSDLLRRILGALFRSQPPATVGTSPLSLN